MRMVILAGSFDPFTNGHLNLVKRISTITDNVIVAVAKNPNKNYLFPAEQRVEIIHSVLSKLDFSSKVDVQITEGLLASLVQEKQHEGYEVALCRGIRTNKDLEYELPMATINKELCGVETIFLLADAYLAQISSSLVKEIASWGKEVDNWVPKNIAKAIHEQLRSNRIRQENA